MPSGVHSSRKTLPGGGIKFVPSAKNGEDYLSLGDFCENIDKI
jgi:hypothetical protein